MTGKLFVDGKDVYTLYDVFVTDGGYNELVNFPPLKSLDSNNWAEEDGEEFDLSSLVLDSREFNIKFACTDLFSRFGTFINLLSDGAYHYFEFKDIDRPYNLRMTTQNALSLVSTAKSFTLRFADDFPLNSEEHVYQEPSSTINSLEGYELDGRSLSDYGITVLEGSLSEVLKSPAVKKNLLVNINSKNGAIYDGEYVQFQTKDVKLNCLMRATSLKEFWRNYESFLYDLIRPKIEEPYERMLYVDETGYEYPCYYKSCSVTDFSPVGDIWFQFSLTLVFTSFRVSEEEFFLASEDGFLIITEDGEFAIDLSTYVD
ncbi:hypothetical protein [Bacteroides sp. 51]|uniref:hypothetical protein n=1 Tax=Bacteroides sp. 51 TaxID=2302938 RepID=UPI0013D83CDD|nr:hypothetical protein [Bacteroides sp. 51]NDV81324.1 hypothetical protein [Bacteroides sp. 51]